MSSSQAAATRLCFTEKKSVCFVYIALWQKDVFVLKSDFGQETWDLNYLTLTLTSACFSLVTHIQTDDTSGKNMEPKLKKSDSGGKRDWEPNSHKKACFFSTILLWSCFSLQVFKLHSGPTKGIQRVLLIFTFSACMTFDSLDPLGLNSWQQQPPLLWFFRRNNVLFSYLFVDVFVVFPPKVWDSVESPPHWHLAHCCRIVHWENQIIR